MQQTWPISQHCVPQQAVMPVHAVSHGLGPHVPSSQ
jgi:hypothetical protein